MEMEEFVATLAKPVPEQVMLKEGGCTLLARLQMVEENLLGHLTTYWWPQFMRKEATQRCGAHGRLGALRPWELRLIKSNVKLLCQCLC